LISRKKIAVISTGNGGQSMAAYLSALGYETALYAREQERVDMFVDRKFELHGVVEGICEVSMISCSMADVIEGAYLIMVTTPAQYAAKAVAPAMAKHLRDGQMVVLNPGRTLGAHVFHHALLKHGCTADIALAETDTFVFTCRCLSVGHPNIYAIKSGVNVAAIDQKDTMRVADALSDLFPGILPAESVLHTGLSNIGMIFHPLPILMNITRVEAKEEFLFYANAISPLVASVLERMDAERVSVAKALGITVPDAFTWMHERYGSKGDSLYERIHSTKAYANVFAPTDIDTRYVYEDILTGCVPVSCLGKALGVETKIIDSVIQFATTVYDYDFHAEGTNEKKVDFRALIENAHAGA